MLKILSSKTITNVSILSVVAILALITACRLFTGEGTADTPVQTTSDLRPYRATPVAQSPASGICGGLAGDVISFTIYSDIPDPRCAEVRAAQKIRVVNRTEEKLHVTIGRFEVDIEPNGEHTFDTPVGEYLAPGVHVLLSSSCCAPEFWLKSD